MIKRKNDIKLGRCFSVGDVVYLSKVVRFNKILMEDALPHAGMRVLYTSVDRT